MHADEAVQAAITRDLWLSGRYRYDPHEFHGPTLNYLSLPSLHMAGRQRFADTTAADFRRTPALFGAAAILLLLLLCDGLGRGAAIAAGGLLALSPAMVFYSRSYIHETLLAFFTLAAIGCGWRCLQLLRLVQNDADEATDGQALRIGSAQRKNRAALWGWAVALGAAVGMMQATKETAVLSYAAAAGALLGTAIRFRRGANNGGPNSSRSGDHSSESDTIADRPAARSAQQRQPLNAKAMAAPLMIAAFAAVATAAVWFSSFGKNPRGIVDAVRTYTPWTERAAGASPHVQPIGYFARRLLWQRDDQGRWWSEGSIALCAVIGGLWAWRKRQSPDASAPTAAQPDEAARGEPPCSTPFSPPTVRRDGHPELIVFLGLYSAILALIYSLIPYKTPWCMVQFWMPAILTAGAGVGVIVRWAWAALQKKNAAGIAAAAGAGLLLAAMPLQLGRQTHRAAFAAAADPRNPYCCAPTLPSVQKLEQRLEALLLAQPESPIAAAVLWHDGYYWPLPWYLRRYEPVGYWTALPAGPTEAASMGEETGAASDMDDRAQATAAAEPPKGRNAADPYSMPVIIASARFDAPLTAKLEQTHLMIDFYALRPDAMLMLWVREDLWRAHLKRLGRL